MTNKEINDVPELFRNGTISGKDAEKLISLYFVKNVKVFALYDPFISEEEYDDKVSDITLYLLINAVSILEKYDSSKATFFNYLYKVIENRNKTWTRKYRNDKRTQQIANNVLKMDQESINVPTPQEELETNISHADSFFNNTVQKSYKLADSTETKSPYPAVETFMKDRKVKVELKSTVALLLKSCCYISDSDILSACQVTGLDFNQLSSISDNLRTGLQDKFIIESRNSRIRNASFIHMNNFRHQYSMCDSTSVYKAMDLKEREMAHYKKWVSHSMGKIRLTPSNKSIADSLHLSERTFTYYLNRAFAIFDKKNESV